MLPRTASDAPKQQFPDSGYRSEHETGAEPEHGKATLPDAARRYRVNHVGSAARLPVDDASEKETSSPVKSVAIPFRSSANSFKDRDEQMNAPDPVAPEACETDSEDELPLKCRIPFTSSKDFPIIPLPSTLARAGFDVAAKQVEKANTEARDKIRARENALRKDGRNGDEGAAKRPKFIEVVVTKERAQYSLAEALENTEQCDLAQDYTDDEDEFGSDDEDSIDEEEEGEGDDDDEKDSEPECV